MKRLCFKQAVSASFAHHDCYIVQVKAFVYLQELKNMLEKDDSFLGEVNFEVRIYCSQYLNPEVEVMKDIAEELINMSLDEEQKKRLQKVKIFFLLFSGIRKNIIVYYCQVRPKSFEDFMAMPLNLCNFS